MEEKPRFQNRCGDQITLPYINFLVSIERYESELSEYSQKSGQKGLNLNILPFFKVNSEGQFLSRKSGISCYRSQLAHGFQLFLKDFNLTFHSHPILDVDSCGIRSSRQK